MMQLCDPSEQGILKQTPSSMPLRCLLLYMTRQKPCAMTLQTHVIGRDLRVAVPPQGPAES